MSDTTVPAGSDDDDDEIVEVYRSSIMLPRDVFDPELARRVSAERGLTHTVTELDGDVIVRLSSSRLVLDLHRGAVHNYASDAEVENWVCCAGEPVMSAATIISDPSPAQELCYVEGPRLWVRPSHEYATYLLTRLRDWNEQVKITGAGAMVLYTPDVTAAAALSVVLRWVVSHGIPAVVYSRERFADAPFLYYVAAPAQSDHAEQLSAAIAMFASSHSVGYRDQSVMRFGTTVIRLFKLYCLPAEPLNVAVRRIFGLLRR